MARNKDFFVNSTPKRDRSFFVKEEKTTSNVVKANTYPIKDKYNSAFAMPVKQGIGDKVANFFKMTLPTAAEKAVDNIKEPFTGASASKLMTEAKLSPQMMVEDAKIQMAKENPTREDYAMVKQTQEVINKYGKPESNFRAISEDTTKLQEQLKSAEKTWQVSPVDATLANTGAGVANIFGSLGSFANSLGADKVPLLKDVTNFAVDGARKAQENAQQYNRGNYGEALGTVTQGVVNLVPYFVLGTGKTAVKGATAVTKYAKYIEPIIKNPSFWYSLTSMWGSKYQEKLDEGYNRFQALGNSILYAVPAALIEVSGGIGAKGKETQSLLRTMGEEIGEEIAQDIMGGISDKIATNHDLPVFSTTKDAIINPKQLAKTAAYTAPIVAIGGGANNVINKTINNRVENQKAQAQINQDLQEIRNKITPATDLSIQRENVTGLPKLNVQNATQNVPAQQTNTTLPTEAEMAQKANTERIGKDFQNDNFHKGLEKFNSKNYTQKDDIVVLNETPQYLYNLGFDENKPVVLNMSKLETIMKEPKGTFNDKNQHGITMDIIEQLPQAIQNPLNVIKNPKYNDRVVIVTELTDQYGDIIIVPIEMNSGGYIENIKNDVNRINTVYGKEYYDIPKNEGKNSYIEYNKDNIIYDIDKDVTKNRDVNSNYRLQLPSRTINTSNNSINPNDKAVNTEYAQNNKNDTASQRSKLRNFYQTAQEGSMVDEGYIKDIRKNKEQFEYNPISNQETLNDARSKVNEDSAKAERDFLSFDSEGLNADDVAVAEVLIADAIAKGDKSKANYLTATLAEKLTQAGQAIQATKIFKRMTPEGMILYAQKEINKINRDLEKSNPKLYNKLKNEGALPKLDDSDIQKITEYMQEAQSYSDDYWNARQKDKAIAKALSVVDNKIPSTALEKVASIRRSGLLLNLKTLMRNLGSNISFGTLEAIKDIPATGIDKLTSLVTGERTVSLPNRAYFSGAKKGAIEGIEDVRDNIRTAGKDSKYELPKKTFKRTDTYKDIVNTFKSGDIKEGSKKAFRRALSDYEDASMYIVEGTDRPFWQGRFESELANQMKLKGLEYGVDTPTTEMLESAQKSADYATFKNKNKVSETFGKIRKVLNGGKPIGAADVFGLTFTNVPGSVATKAYDYSPAGLFTTAKELYNAISKNGKFDQRNFVDSLSRSLVGSSGWALGAYLIAQGIIRGASDDDDDKANAEKQMGLQENSLNISALGRLAKGEDTTLQKGDKFYSFDWLQPAASPFLVGSDIYKAQKEGENPAFAGAKSAVNQIADMSSLSQVSKLFKGYSGSDLFENVAKVVGEFPSSFIPTLWNNAGQFTDEYKRVSYDATDAYFKTNVNKTLAKIPGLRTTLEKQIDTFGNEQKQYRNGNDFWSTFINPGYNSTYDPTPLQEEILRVYNKTGDKGVFPITAASSVTYNSESLKLNPKQRMTYQKTAGEYVTQVLSKVIESDAYNKFDDNQKAALLKEVISDSNTLGKASVGVKNKTYDDYMKKIEELGNIPLSTYYNAYTAQKGIESDKDASGKTIENSKSIKAKAAIDKSTDGLTTSQKKRLYDIFNVSKTVQEGKATTKNTLPTLKQQRAKLPTLKK